MPVGQVRDAHRRVGDVDVLAAGTGGAVDVDPQLLVVDDDVGDVLEERRDLEGGERGLALALRVERAHAHEPVDAVLGAEPAVRVAALHHERGRGDAGLRTRRHLVELDVEARGARPSAGTCAGACSAQSCASAPPSPDWISQMTSLPSCSPVNRLRSSSWSNSVPRATSDVLDLGGDRVVGLLAGQLGEGLGVVDARGEAVPPVEVVADLGQLTGDLAGDVGVVPQVGPASPRSRAGAAGRAGRRSGGTPAASSRRPRRALMSSLTSRIVLRFSPVRRSLRQSDRSTVATVPPRLHARRGSEPGDATGSRG